MPSIVMRQMKLALTMICIAIGFASIAIEAQAHNQYSGSNLQAVVFTHDMTVGAIKDTDISLKNAFFQAATATNDCCQNGDGHQAVCPSGSSSNSSSCSSNCFVALVHDSIGLSREHSSNIDLDFVSIMSGRRPTVDERPPKS